MLFNPDEELKEFPCCFTLMPGSKVTHERYLHLQNGLDKDLQNEDCLEAESIRNTNLLAWVLFCLNEKEKSFNLSQKVLELTCRTNITALGNYVYISFRLGYKIKSENCMKELRALKNQENFESLKTDALAEQAYAYSRLGGLKNTKKAKDIYIQCIEACPTNWLWKYGLGLVCRRLTKFGLICSNKENTDMTELTIDCVKVLFEVAENAENYLKQLAYSQLTTIRAYNRNREHNDLFHNMTVDQLCKKALSFGRHNPVVLTQCGKSMKGVNIDEAISLLKESLALKAHNTAYGHLGLCYQKKAELIAAGKYFDRESRSASSFDRGRAFHLERTRQREFQSESPRRPRDYNGFFRPQEFQYEHTGSRQSSKDYKRRSEQQYESQRQGPMQNEFPMRAQIQNDSPRRWEFQHESPSRVQSQNEPLKRGEVQEESAKFDRYLHEPLRSRQFQNESRPWSSRVGRNQNEPSSPSGKFIRFSSESPRPRQVHCTSQCKIIKGKNDKSLSNYVKSKKTKVSFQHEEKLYSAYSLGTLRLFIDNECRKLDEKSKLVKDAIQCYKKAKEISHGENIPATNCLGKILFNTEQFEDALAQFNQIIDRNDETDLISTISAYEWAGKCLQKLSEYSEKNRQQFQEEARDCFAKAITLAVDLATSNPNYNDCDKTIWGYLKILSVDDSHKRNQEMGHNHDSIRPTVEEFNITSEQPVNADNDLLVLNNYIDNGHFEEALAFARLNITKPYFANETATVKAKEMLLKIYLGAAWSRLKKLSPDCKRAFQKLFEMKYYDQCKRNLQTSETEEDEEEEMNNLDVLIINDSEVDHEKTSSQRLALNLLHVIKILFGLKTLHHLEIKLTSSQEYGTEELNIQKISKFILILVIVENSISENYSKLLETLSQTKGPKLLVMNCGTILECPDFLKNITLVDLNDLNGPLAKLSKTSIEEDEFDMKRYEQSKPFLEYVLEKLFGGSPDAVLRLFCLLVGEDFEFLLQQTRLGPANAASSPEAI